MWLGLLTVWWPCSVTEGPEQRRPGLSEPRDPGGRRGRSSPGRVPSGRAFCYGETHGQPQSQGRRIRPPLLKEFVGILNLIAAQLSCPLLISFFSDLPGRLGCGDEPGGVRHAPSRCPARASFMLLRGRRGRSDSLLLVGFSRAACGSVSVTASCAQLRAEPCLGHLYSASAQ